MFRVLSSSTMHASIAAWARGCSYSRRRTGDSSLRITASELKVDARRRWSFVSLFVALAQALLPNSCAKAECGIK